MRRYQFRHKRDADRIQQLSEKRKKEKGDKPRPPRRGKRISFESAIFLFGLLNAGSDKAMIERAFKLALRGPDLLRDALKAWALSQGEDVDRLMSGEPTAPATRTEVKELVGPYLKKGAEMAAFAQIADIYLFDKGRTPENIVYAFYIGTRFVISKEREPTNEEAKRIWEITLWIAQSSKIGKPHWEELERQGPVYLKDWVNKRKEDARKKYVTFLSQKKRAEATAENALDFLVTDIFGDEEDQE